MGEGVGWIAHAFKLFDALINPLRPLPPDEPVATVAGEDAAPEAPAGDPSASKLPREAASEADALAPDDEREIEALPAEQIESPPVQLDDEGRRKLIRQLFNEYWSGVEDKPPTFAERLEIAERYINAQLADRAVGWRLDAVTRKQLGLPSQ
jgi:hypothetical protein